MVDAFHVITGRTALDPVRRVQNEQTGHRGRRRDPLYRARRALLAGKERLDQAAAARLRSLLELGDPHGEAAITYAGTLPRSRCSTPSAILAVLSGRPEEGARGGRALYDGVYDRWSKLPQEQRPRLYVAGESLGSFGAETAFSGEYDLRNRTAGTPFAGPPNFNTLFREFSDNRDPASREIQPVYWGGRTVRFAEDATADIPPDNQAWTERGCST